MLWLVELGPRILASPAWVQLCGVSSAVLFTIFCLNLPPSISKSAVAAPSQTATTHGNNSPVYQIAGNATIHPSTSVAPESPYVFLDPGGALDLTLAVGQRPTGMLHVKNVGTKQAFELVAWRRMGIVPWPLPQGFDFATPRTGQGMKTALPGEVTHWPLNCLESDPPLTQLQFDALRSGTLRFIVYGRIEYKDNLGNTRWTNFCRLISPASDPNHGQFGLQQPAINNDADSIGR